MSIPRRAPLLRRSSYEVTQAVQMTLNTHPTGCQVDPDTPDLSPTQMCLRARLRMGMGRLHLLEFWIDRRTAFVTSLSKVGVHNSLSTRSLLGLRAALLVLMEHAHLHGRVPRSTTVVEREHQFGQPSFTSLLHLKKEPSSHILIRSNNTTISRTSARWSDLQDSPS